MSMPAGKYFIGDLCYVLDRDGEWDAYCEITIVGRKCLFGEFAMPDGRRFATFSTLYGDGKYLDGEGTKYPVDSGSIGCILMSDIPHLTEAEARKMGGVYVITYEFTPSEKEGYIRFGPITVDTAGEDEDGDDDY